uniref:Uncharacterized protein n=1 Tax=Panagrolaimus sp. ES5 TaxID=591445 RepID=A0AC34G3Z0_9BILA
MKFHIFALFFLFAAIFVGDAFVLEKDGNGRQEEIVPPKPQLGLCKSNADCPKGQICFHRIGDEWGECH